MMYTFYIQSEAIAVYEGLELILYYKTCIVGTATGPIGVVIDLF